MARQGWGGSIATATGVAAGAGAAQLGFGYGLGIINWTPAVADAGTAAWVASLVWATWIGATSTVLGAVSAQRLHERRSPEVAASGPAAEGMTVDATAASTATPPAPARPGGTLRRLCLAVAAGFGALITVLLVAVPARMAQVPDASSPRAVAAGYAAVGVLVGVLVAAWALHSRAVAGNVTATAAWLWLLAVVAVADSVLAGRGLTTAQLGIWQFSSDSGQFWLRDYFYWPGAVLSLGSALVIGVFAARRAARLPAGRVGTTASGAAGPLLVATAYFLAVPRLTEISPEQVSAHLIAPYAVIVGVGGSTLVAALAQRADRRRAQRRAPDPGDDTGSALADDVNTAPAGTALADDTGAAGERRDRAGRAVTVPRQRTGEPSAHPARATATSPRPTTGTRAAKRAPAPDPARDDTPITTSTFAAVADPGADPEPHAGRPPAESAAGKPPAAAAGQPSTEPDDATADPAPRRGRPSRRPR